MDPDEALKEIREIIERADNIIEKGNTLDDIVDEFSRLVDLVDGLDGWMVRGGALPKPWMVNR